MKAQPTAAMALQVLPFVATMASFYAFILLFWSPQWEAVYAIALAVETLAVVVEDWPSNRTSAVIFGTHSLPAFLVAVTQSKALAGISIVVWLVRTAAHMLAKMRHSRSSTAKVRFFDPITI